MMIAQHQIEAASSPSMTSFTTQLALRNNAMIEKSMVWGATSATLATAVAVSMKGSFRLGP